MSTPPAHYLVRANGYSAHADPTDTRHYVRGEPPMGQDMQGYANWVPYCLSEGIVRIGWPDTGDLSSSKPKQGALRDGYGITDLPKHVQRYLRQFREIVPGSIILSRRRTVRENFT